MTSPLFKNAVLFVSDMAASRHFYEGLLEQKVEVDVGANVGYAGGLALWQKDSAARHIHGQTAAAGPAPLGRDNLEVYFETEAIDAMIEKFERGGVRFVHPLKEQPWAQRAVRVYDPDGHIVEVGEPMPTVVRRLARAGADRASIVKRTMMPRAFVDQALDGE